MTKASRDPEAEPPTLLKQAQGSSQPVPDGSCEVGSGALFHGSSEWIPFESLLCQLAIEHIRRVCVHFRGGDCHFMFPPFLMTEWLEQSES